MIRTATLDDAQAIRDIYAPVVLETPISFEFEPPSVGEMRGRIERTLGSFPWLVETEGETIVGYAYAGIHSARAAYQWSADVSVYVASQARRTGVGRRLYEALFDILKRQGYVNAYAGITLPNQASVSLHESLGFIPVGVYQAVGWKFGRWHDVGWWQLQLADRPENPQPPHPFRDLQES